MKMKYKVTFINREESDNASFKSVEQAIRHICSTLNKGIDVLTQVPIATEDGADYIYHHNTHIVAVITRI